MIINICIFVFCLCFVYVLLKPIINIYLIFIMGYKIRNFLFFCLIGVCSYFITNIFFIIINSIIYGYNHEETTQYKLTNGLNLTIIIISLFIMGCVFKIDEYIRNNIERKIIPVSYEEKDQDKEEDEIEISETFEIEV